MIPKLLPRDIDVRLIQPRFERALRRRVGRGLTARVALADAVGVDLRTIEGYFTEFRLPGLPVYFRLAAVLGADFENEIRGGIEQAPRAVSLIDLIESERLLRGAADRLDAIIAPKGAEIRKLRESA